MEKYNQSQTHLAITTWLDDFIPDHLDWVKKCRVEYLKQQKREWIKKELGFIRRVIVNNLWKYYKIDLSTLDRINKSLYNYEHPTVEELDKSVAIENARNYPIENLLEVDEKGFAICPFHADTHPSAYCKNNFLYCFACGESADAIKIYQHIYKCSFKEALKKMQ